MTLLAALPVSGTPVRLREPTGADELVVLESDGPAATTMLELARRLVSARGEPVDWQELPAVELAAVALLIRRSWLGDLIRAEAFCPAPGCEEAIDVPVNVEAYLAHHRPTRYRGLRECAPGWFTLAGSAEVRFRIPTVADLIGVLDDPRASSLLLERCVEPVGLSTTDLRRVERALEAIAPRLDGVMSGPCPACGEAIELRFEPMQYVLDELREACGELFAQVHDIAFAYHWSERSILALDRLRRHVYARLIRNEAVLA
jgi:hypothetical protein